MVISCEEVWRELSNYIDNDIDPALRAEMEAHFAQCKHCTAVLDGTRNVIRLVGDERAFTVPAGFSRRLYQKLSKHNAMSRGPLRGWLVAAVAAGIAYAMLTIARAESPAPPLLKSEHSQPAARLPVGLVAINEKGKTLSRAALPLSARRGKTGERRNCGPERLHTLRSLRERDAAVQTPRRNVGKNPHRATCEEEIAPDSSVYAAPLRAKESKHRGISNCAGAKDWPSRLPHFKAG